jgi:hypothetical protein
MTLYRCFNLLINQYNKLGDLITTCLSLQINLKLLVKMFTNPNQNNKLNVLVSIKFKEKINFTLLQTNHK